MHVVVTGTSGFIGRNLLPKLLSQGHTVTSLTRMKNDWSHVAALDNFSEIRVADLSKIQEDDFPMCDVVVHLAGLAQRNVKESELYENINYQATIHLADLAERKGCKHFIFMSSAKVHAEATDTPINSNSPFAPPDLYSETKVRTEHALFNSGSSMPVTAIRPPPVLGLPAKSNFAHLIRLATSRLPVPVSNTNSRRCFIGLDNLCSAILTCVEKRNPKGGGYLIHDESPISTEELLKVIAKAHNVKLRVAHLPRPIFAAGNKAIHLITGRYLIAPFYKDFLIDCDLFRKHYGWTPEKTTAQQVQLMFENQ